MILTHPSGWTQSGELWRTLLCSASNLFQQIERKPPLIACKTGQKRSFSECFAHQGLCSIMLQETTGLKQQWGSNGASANAWPASWLQPRVEITYATKSHERSGEPAELGLKRWPLPWWGGGFKQLDGETRAGCVSHLPCRWQTAGACWNHHISVRSVTGKALVIANLPTRSSVWCNT